MGSRSRYMTKPAAAGAAGVGAWLGVAVAAWRRARRRARLRGASPADAPGHRHLASPPDARAERRAAAGARPFAKHRRGLRHPGKG
jgi:hypothetical protein